jgi:hypothetical protein
LNQGWGDQMYNFNIAEEERLVKDLLSSLSYFDILTLYYLRKVLSWDSIYLLFWYNCKFWGNL